MSDVAADHVDKRTSCLSELDGKNIEWVSELIAQNKLELYQYYSDRDKNIDGHIEQRVWASGLTEVLYSVAASAAATGNALPLPPCTNHCCHRLASAAAVITTYLSN